MNALLSSQILDVWEHSYGRPALDCVLSLLSVVHEDSSPEALAALPLGRRDELLLELRGRTVGPRFDAFSRCIGCRAPVQFQLEIQRLLESAPDGNPLQPPTCHRVECDGFEVDFRLPDSRDLDAASRTGDVEAGSAQIVDRCITRVSRGEVKVGSDAARESVRDFVASEMSRLDPLSDIRIAVECPSCSESWETTLDVVSYVWSEFSELARSLIAEVAALARAYGWHESDILSMNPRRRRLYLELSS